MALITNHHSQQPVSPDGRSVSEAAFSPKVFSARGFNLSCVLAVDVRIIVHHFPHLQGGSQRPGSAVHTARSQTSHAWQCVMQLFETKFAVMPVSAIPFTRGDGIVAVGVSVSRVSVCQLDMHVGFIGLHRTRVLRGLHVCTSACSRSIHPLAPASTFVVAWDSSRVRRGSHERTA